MDHASCFTFFCLFFYYSQKQTWVPGTVATGQVLALHNFDRVHLGTLVPGCPLSPLRVPRNNPDDSDPDPDSVLVSGPEIRARLAQKVQFRPSSGLTSWELTQFGRSAGLWGVGFSQCYTSDLCAHNLNSFRLNKCMPNVSERHIY